MICKNCGQEIDDNSIDCAHCGVFYMPSIKSSIFLRFISALFPLLGVFIYYSYKRRIPIMASSILNWTITGILIWIIIYIAALFLGIVFCL